LVPERQKLRQFGFMDENRRSVPIRVSTLFLGPREMLLSRLPNRYAEGFVVQTPAA
jgi:hypothetical protein